jgi:DNA-binding transcriptional MocR family regulator
MTKPPAMGAFFMRDQDNIRPTFTTIYHDARIELGLNPLEYIILDTVFILSQNSKGYCFKSLRSMANDLGMSVSGTHTAYQRLIDRELLIKLKHGYKCAQAFIDVVHFKRSKIEHSVRKSNASVRKSEPQQMLDIHKNNNRKAYGTPRLNSRVPEQIKPLSETAKRLQARVEEIRNSNNQQSTEAA